MSRAQPELNFNPVKRRHPRKRKALPRALPALELSQIVGVGTGDDALFLTAVFDTTEDAPLNPVGGASPAKWNARYNTARFVGVEMELLGFDRIAFGFALTEYEVGADEL